MAMNLSANLGLKIEINNLDSIQESSKRNLNMKTVYQLISGKATKWALN